MAAEAAYNSWGPRYAPPDPTLPKPWTALIDGSTGFMYYWNLETNITQYEKPTAVLPVVPSVSALVFSTPEQKRLPQQGNYTPQSSLQYTGYQQYPRNIIQKPPVRYGGSQFSQLQQKSVDCNQYGPKFQKQMSNVSPIGMKTVFKDSPPFNAKNGGLALVPHQPKFQTPMPKNHGKINSGNPTVVASSDAMTHNSVEIDPKKHDITATGDKVPAPFMSFESTGFPPEILKEISADSASPTPIQAQTWPIALQNRDMVAIAKTDSGKTLGYLIPAFMLLRRCNNNRQHGPTVVVLSPTRELALQIQDEAVKFGRSIKISCSCLYGEAPKGPQLKDLERGADIVVATPGRLNDVIEMRKVDFGQVSLLVIDEVDRMFDMGFEPQIRKIVKEIPPRKQTLMYTATWPTEVRKIASDLLVNPVQVNIDSADELAANKSITQDCKHAPNLIKVDGANKFVPQNVREISTHGGRCGRDGGIGARGGRRDDRLGGVGSGGLDGGWKRNDRLKDSCGRGQFDYRRDGDRSRGRRHSRSQSRSRSCSRSWTPVRRGRSRSRSYSYSRSQSPSPRWGRSRTRTPVRRERRRSRSRSSSRSWRRSYSRSRSWSRSRSRSRSRSWTPYKRQVWGKSK